MRKERKQDVFFHRAGLRNTVIVLQVVLIIIIVLVIGVGVVMYKRPPLVFYATSTSGKLTQLTPYDSADLAKNAKLNFEDG